MNRRYGTLSLYTLIGAAGTGLAFLPPRHTNVEHTPNPEVRAMLEQRGVAFGLVPGGAPKTAETANPQPIIHNSQAVRPRPVSRLHPVGKPLANSPHPSRPASAWYHLWISLPTSVQPIHLEREL